MDRLWLPGLTLLKFLSWLCSPAGRGESAGRLHRPFFICRTRGLQHRQSEPSCYHGNTSHAHPGTIRASECCPPHTRLYI